MKGPLDYSGWLNTLDRELWLDIVIDAPMESDDYKGLGKTLYEKYLIRFKRHQKILEILKTKNHKDI